MAKHLLDETAEFKLPRPGRHAGPDEETPLEPTLRFDAGLRERQPLPKPRPDARAR
ncbi:MULTISPECIES: hypothetical protein [unclassified Blastococcus]